MAIRYLDIQPNSSASSTTGKIRYLDEPTTLQGGIEKSDNALLEIGKGILGIPSAVGQGLQQVGSNIAQTYEKAKENPTASLTSAIPALGAGAVEGAINLGLGVKNIPGTLQNLGVNLSKVTGIPMGERVQPTTTEDITRQWTEISPLIGQMIETNKKAQEQVPLASMIGQIIPYALGATTGATEAGAGTQGLNALQRAIQIANSPTARLAGMGVAGTPTTKLSERVSSGGANILASPEVIGGMVKNVKATPKAVAKGLGFTKVDEILRDKLAGISPEVYSDIQKQLGTPKIEETIGKGSINQALGSKEIVDKVNKEIKDISTNIEMVLKKPENTPEYHKEILDNVALEATNAIQDAIVKSKKASGMEVGEAKKGLSESPVMYNTSDIKLGVDKILNKFNSGIKDYHVAIGEGKLIKDINSMLSDSGSMLNLEKLNQIKKYIQDDTTFGGASSEGKVLKDSLRRYIDDKITSADTKLGEANKTHYELMSTLKEVKALGNEGLASKLVNQDNIAFKNITAKLQKLKSLKDPELNAVIDSHIGKVLEAGSKYKALQELKNNPLYKTSNFEDLTSRLSKGEKLTDLENRYLNQLEKAIPDTEMGAYISSMRKAELLPKQQFQGMKGGKIEEYTPFALGSMAPGFGNVAVGAGFIRALYTPAGQRLQLAIRNNVKNGINIVTKPIEKLAKKAGISSKNTKSLLQQTIASQINKK